MDCYLLHSDFIAEVSGFLSGAIVSLLHQIDKPSTGGIESWIVSQEHCDQSVLSLLCQAPHHLIEDITEIILFICKYSIY